MTETLTTGAAKVALVEGSTGVLDKYGWAEKQAVIRVMNTAYTVGQDDLLVNALAVAEAAGFTYGVVHPHIPNLYLLGERALKAINKTQVDIGVTYKRRESSKEDPNYIAIRGSATLVTEKTNKDYADDDIIVSWLPDEGEDEKFQTGTVDVQTPCFTLEFSKLLSVNPAWLGAALIGCTNVGTFQGNPPETWLCSGFDFSSPDGGIHWETTPKFVFNANKWRQTVYYTLETGKPPSNWNAAYNDGKTVKVIQVYGMTDFDVLGLPNVYTGET